MPSIEFSGQLLVPLFALRPLLKEEQTDYLEIQNLIFGYFQCYDKKDWEGLQKLVAPSVRMDYTLLGGELHESATPQQVAAQVSNLIGDPCLQTQHLLGASRWVRLDNDTVEVEHQARVAHQRYAAASSAEVVNHGHGHGALKQTFQKVEGKWKMAGFLPTLSWAEFDLEGTLNPKPS